MSSKIKNIIILVVVAIVLGLVYFLFIKKAPEQPSLVSESGEAVPGDTTSQAESSITKEFLTLLLNVQNIKINDQVLYDPAFSSLRDSTIEIVDDGSEGRPNPFAPIGADMSASVGNVISNTNTTEKPAKDAGTSGAGSKNTNTASENEGANTDQSTQ